MQASNGQHRLTGQDRYFVLALDVTSAYGPFVYGVNAIVVPRSIFLDSKLKADFTAGSYWPLDGPEAKLYGEDLGKPDVSEGVAGVIAKSLSGSNANNVLDRLLRNTTNVLVYSYVDITSYAVRANLPADVVRILPWEKVTNGPTGGMPADFWQKIGASASALVNTLVCASNPVCLGQMIYQGLVALGKFLVNLGQAIWNWGMREAGKVWEKVGQAVQKAGEILDSFVDMVIEVARAILKGVVDTLLGPILDLLDSWAASSAMSVNSLGDAHAKGNLQGEDSELIATLLNGMFPALVFGLSTALVASLIVVGFIMSATPVGAIVAIIVNLIKDIIRAAIEHWIATTVLVSALVGWTLSNVAGGAQLSSGVVAVLSTAWVAFLVAYGIHVKGKWLKDAVGLGLNILGTLFVFKVLPLADTVKSRVIAAILGTSVSATGLLLALIGEDVAPAHLGFVDELLGAAMLGFDLAQSGIAVSECLVSGVC